MLLLLAGLGVSAGLHLPAATAQIIELPGDVPPPSDTPPTGLPAVQGDPSPAPVAQSGDETQPTDEPVPAVADPAATPEPVATGPWGVPPVKLTIPALGVEAAVEPVAEDADGAMAVPTDPDGVAWWSLGPGMGVPGNVVFAAHVNWDNRLRVFGLLHRLGEGDAIQVIDEQGRGFEYVVESSRWVRAEGAPIEEIFAQPDVPIITLITCGGEYVASRREYLDRLIVKAKGAPTS